MMRRVIDPITQRELRVPDGIGDMRAIEHAWRPG